MKGKRVKVIEENEHGRNVVFKDIKNNQVMSRVEFVRKIENGVYQDYDVRVINGVKTPVSKPDNSEGNNLG